jgi:anti-sigma-K factor RskA
MHMNTSNTTPTPEPASTPPNWWRIVSILCFLVIAIGAASGVSMYEMFNAQLTHLQAKLKNSPQIKYIAVLLDAKQAPGVLVSFDPQDGFLQLQRLTDIKEGPDDSMQLWATNGGKPQSLGVLTPKIRTAQLPVTSKALAGITDLAISVENRGGVEPGTPPRLPYLYTGALIQKAQ